MLVVAAGATVQLDVRLEDTLSLRTLGEDPTAIVATYFNRPDPPKGPTPRLTNGKPDLSGVWLGGPLDLSGLDLQPWAEALLRERVDNHMKDWPPSYCLPAGAVPFSTSGFFKLVHHPATLVFMVENATGFTQMLLDGRPHPPSVGPNWLGHSVGSWDGDTLVVDAIGFRDRGWLNFDGQPHSDRLHVTERLRRPDLGHLEIEITLDDQGAFRKPWTGTKYATLAPDVELQEYVCNENNKDAAHLVGRWAPKNLPSRVPLIRDVDPPCFRRTGQSVPYVRMDIALNNSKPAADRHGSAAAGRTLTSRCGSRGLSFRRTQWHYGRP